MTVRDNRNQNSVIGVHNRPRRALKRIGVLAPDGITFWIRTRIMDQMIYGAMIHFTVYTKKTQADFCLSRDTKPETKKRSGMWKR